MTWIKRNLVDRDDPGDPTWFQHWSAVHSQSFSRNLFTALNACAVSLMRYSCSTVKWTQEELYRLDADSRKLLTMHGAFSANSGVDRLYIPRRNGGRGLISVWFTVEHEKSNLSYYVHYSLNALMRLVARSFA